MSTTDSLQLQTEEKLMNGSDCVAEPIKMTQVQEQLVTLEGAINRAEDLASVVRQKLTPVLSLSLEPVKTSEEDVDPPLVDLASTLRVSVNRTTVVGDILADVIERMEL